MGPDPSLILCSVIVAGEDVFAKLVDEHPDDKTRVAARMMPVMRYLWAFIAFIY
jgi:hypothetical protein